MRLVLSFNLLYSTDDLFTAFCADAAALSAEADAIFTVHFDSFLFSNSPVFLPHSLTSSSRFHFPLQ
jgi:hypothetical protein